MLLGGIKAPDSFTNSEYYSTGLLFGVTVDSEGNIYYSESGGYYTDKVIKSSPEGKNTKFEPIIEKIEAQVFGKGLVGARKVAVYQYDIYVTGLNTASFSYYRSVNGIMKISKGTIETLERLLIGSNTFNDFGMSYYCSSYDFYPILGSGIAFDSHGNLFVAETYNHSVRKISTNGDTSIVAGVTYDGFADGPASSARFFLPSGVAIDSSDDVYISDYGNHAMRKLSNGIVSTIAGSLISESPGFVDAMGSATRFNGPHYIADYNNNPV